MFLNPIKSVFILTIFLSTHRSFLRSFLRSLLRSSTQKNSFFCMSNMVVVVVPIIEDQMCFDNDEVALIHQMRFTCRTYRQLAQEFVKEYYRRGFTERPILSISDEAMTFVFKSKGHHVEVDDSGIHFMTNFMVTKYSTHCIDDQLFNCFVLVYN